MAIMGVAYLDDSTQVELFPEVQDYSVLAQSYLSVYKALFLPYEILAVLHNPHVCQQ